MIGKVVAGSSIAAIIVLVFMINVTRPSEVGPLGILAVFVLFYIAVLGATTLVIYFVSRLLRRIGAFLSVRRPIQVLSLARSYYFASIIALGPVMLVGMQSVTTIGVQEVVLVSLFVALGCIYVGKRTN